MAGRPAEGEREREPVREQRCTSQSQVSRDVILSESCLREQVVSKTSQLSSSYSTQILPSHFFHPLIISKTAPSFSSFSHTSTSCHSLSSFSSSSSSSPIRLFTNYTTFSHFVVISGTTLSSPLFPAFYSAIFLSRSFPHTQRLYLALFPLPLSLSLL